MGERYDGEYIGKNKLAETCQVLRLGRVKLHMENLMTYPKVLPFQDTWPLSVPGTMPCWVRTERWAFLGEECWSLVPHS